MKNVDDLTGIELDIFLLKALNIKYKYDYYKKGNRKRLRRWSEKWQCYLHCDNIGWNFIGPLIEKYKLEIEPLSVTKPNWKVFSSNTAWAASSVNKDLLTAIKKCIIKIKYGKQVK